MTAGLQSGFLERLILQSLLLFVLLLLVPVESASALDPSQSAKGYLSKNFSHEDGLVGGVISDMVQSREGFLWIDAQGSLVRFDGRRFSNFEPEWIVSTLTLGPDGDLWVGSRDELKRIPAANLNQLGRLPAVSYHLPSGSLVVCLHFSRTGILWVGTDRGLYRFEASVFSSVMPRVFINRIEETATGHMLVVTAQGFIELDGSQRLPHPELEGQLAVNAADIFHVFEDSHGITWFCTKSGVARRIGGHIEKLGDYGPKGHGAFRAYEDLRGNVWFAKDEGLFRATNTGLEFVAAGMRVRKIYSDQEGDLWIGTNGDGLFRFKDPPGRIFTTADGLPDNLAMTVLGMRDGTLWTGFNCGGLSHFDGHNFHTYKEKDGLVNSCVWSLAEDANHDLWIGTFGGGVFRFRGGHFTQYSESNGLVNNSVLAVVAAHDGSLWVGTAVGISRIKDGQINNYRSVDGLTAFNAFKVYEDRTGEIWVTTTQGLARFVGDHFVNSPLVPNNRPYPLGEDRADDFYFSAEPVGGIFRMENNRLVSVIANVEPDGMVESEQGDLWFTGSSILRFPSGVLRQPHEPDDPYDFETLGSADGLNLPDLSGGVPMSALTRDGKLWIATTRGLVMLDLPRLSRTDRKPAIHMEPVTVGRNQQLPGNELLLPAGTHHLELNFDAVEISAPEKIRLQYRLDSVDSQWLDATPPGHAIYNSIPVGTHAFHVRACNRSGIWDRAGMVYYVTQQPYFYQTRWFLFATIAFGLLVIAGLYQLRLRQVAGTLSARFEGQLAERTRIARELHDTLLQSFSALLLRFQAVSKMLPARPEDAKQRVDSAIEQAASAIAEGRDAVHELRSEGPADNDLAQAIGNLGRELLSGPASANPPEFRVQVEGTPKNLNPMVRDEACRIAAEALRNAIRYAGASKIEVEIRYDQQQLRLRIRDDGKGIDPDVLEQGHAPGHWGLRGMRERASLAGGNLEVWSEVGSGSEVELTIPSAKAYAKPASSWPFFSRSWRSKRP